MSTQDSTAPSTTRKNKASSHRFVVTPANGAILDWWAHGAAPTSSVTYSITVVTSEEGKEESIGSVTASFSGQKDWNDNKPEGSESSEDQTEIEKELVEFADRCFGRYMQKKDSHKKIANFAEASGALKYGFQAEKLPFLFQVYGKEQGEWRFTKVECGTPVRESVSSLSLQRGESGEGTGPAAAAAG